MARDFGNTLQTATPINSTAVRRNMIGGKDKFDFFKFDLLGRGNVSISLSKLTNKANITLFDSNGRIVARSGRFGGNKKQINALLEAGEYFIRVSGKSGKGKETKYQLNLASVLVPEPLPGLNQAPTDLSLSNASILENKAADSFVGLFSSLDPNVGDAHTYTLVGGAGSADNTAFTIEGNALKAKQSFDFETKQTYSIRVRTDDGKGGSFEKPLTITIGDVDDKIVPPVQPPGNTNPKLSLVSTSASRGSSITIGENRLKATDAEQTPGQLAYTVTDAPDNGTLLLNGNVLKAGSTLTQADINSNSLVYKSLPGQQVLGSASLVDVLEIDGSKVFFTERDAFGTATLQFKDLSTGKEQTLSTNVDYASVTPPGGFSSVLNLSNGGVDGANIAWSDGGSLFFYNGNTSTKSVNLSEKLPGFFDFNFYAIDGSNVVFKANDGNDYELFLYKGASGALERLTDNSDDDIGVKIDGNFIAWASRGAGSFYDAYLYDISKGNPIQNAVNLTPNNLFGNTDADVDIVGLSGKNVVISALESGVDYELFFSNGLANGLTRLTTNNVDDTFAGVKGNTVTWTTGGFNFSTGGTTDLEIAVQTVAPGSTPVVTQNNVDDFVQAVDGSHIVWSAFAGGVDRLFYRNGTGAVVELTKNQTIRTGASEEFLGIDGVNVVWKSQVDGGTDQLFFGNMATGQVKQLTNITTGNPLEFGAISGSNVLYSIQDSIYLANGNSGSPILVSPTGGSFTGFGKHSGFSVAWTRPSGTGEQGVFGNFASADSFGVTVADGVGGSASGTYNVTLS